jgi:hypothetical protein
VNIDGSVKPRRESAPRIATGPPRRYADAAERGWRLEQLTREVAMRFVWKRAVLAGATGLAIIVAPIAFTVAIPGAITPAAATAPGPDTVQYVQTTGTGGSFIKYIPGNSSIAPTTESLTGGGGCSTPTPSVTPILGLSAFKYSTTTYTDAAPAAATVGAHTGRTGVCSIPASWALEPSEALDFSVGTNALVAGRVFTEANLIIGSNTKVASTVRLVEYLGSSQVCSYTVGTTTLGTGPACKTFAVPSDQVTVDTGVVTPGFDRIAVQLPAPPSASSASVSVIGPLSTFTLGTGAALTLVKTASPATYGAVGQAITYTYTITDSGGSTLGPAQFTVSDNKINGGTAFNCGPSTQTLAPGASFSCTNTYLITQADIDAGHVTNAATASGAGLTSNSSTATVNAVTSPAITLAKSALPATYNSVGTVITYTYTVTDSGNTTLGPAQFTVSDNKINGGTAFNCGPSTQTLAPSKSFSCTKAYSITQADIDAGHVTNAATASGAGLTSNSSSATVNAVQDPELTLVKTDSLYGADYDAPGQVITYTLTATNTGNVMLHAVLVSDAPVLAGYSCSPVSGSDLVPGESVTCTGTHTVTLDDLTAGSITDTGSASSTEVKATDAVDTVNAKQMQICTNDTITSSSSDNLPTDGTVVAAITVDSLPTGNGCKNYSYFKANASAVPGGDEVDFLSQPLAGAHVTATFDWGYTGFCTPNAPLGSAQACPVTYVDFGSGPQAQTFCAAADPNGVTTPPWCTTGRSFSYVNVPDPSNPGATIIVTHITETWDGYGDIVFRH